MSKALIHVVDDDPIYGNTIKKILNLRNYNNVELFKSGESCIDRLGDKPDLIILDFSLETLNGLDVLRLIKSNHPKTKVVFLTSLNDNMELQDKCKQEGALGFFQKSQSGIDELILWMEKNVSGSFFSFLK